MTVVSPLLAEGRRRSSSEDLTTLSEAERPRPHPTGFDHDEASQEARARLTDRGSDHRRLLLPAASRKSEQQGSRDPPTLQEHELAEVLVVRDENALSFARERDHLVILGAGFEPVDLSTS